MKITAKPRMSKARRMRPGDTVYHRNLKKYARLIWTNATESCIVIDETEELRVTTQMLDLMLDHPTIQDEELLAELRRPERAELVLRAAQFHRQARRKNPGRTPGIAETKPRAKRLKPGDYAKHRNLGVTGRVIWSNATESCIIFHDGENQEIELRVSTPLLDGVAETKPRKRSHISKLIDGSLLADKIAANQMRDE